MESLRSGVFLLPLFAMVVVGVQSMPNSHKGEMNIASPSAPRHQYPENGKNPVIADPSDKLKDLEVSEWPLDLVTEPVQKKVKARQNPKKYQPPTRSTSSAPTRSTSSAPTTTTTTTVEVSSTTTTPSTEIPSH